MAANLQALTGVDLSRLEDRLSSLCMGLTPREVQVCARLLSGMTYEGVAIDLGLCLPTVKTYRIRAFGRLGIHFRSQLYPLALGA